MGAVSQLKDQGFHTGTRKQTANCVWNRTFVFEKVSLSKQVSW